MTVVTHLSTSKAKAIFLGMGANPISSEMTPLLRSWRRSQQLGLNVNDKVIFNPVSRSLQRGLEEGNRELLASSIPELVNLSSCLRRTEWALSVLDRFGNVIHTIRPDSPAFRGLSLAFRIGVNLGESSAGTTGPACSIAEKQPVVVSGEEHYLQEASEFLCYSAPIFGGNNELVGVINASRQYKPGHINGVLMATLQAAQQIENRLIEASGECIFVKISDISTGDMSGRGLVAFNRDGVIVAANRYAVTLLGLVSFGQHFFSNYFQDDFDSLVDGLRSSAGPMTIESHCGQFFSAELHEPAAKTTFTNPTYRDSRSPACDDLPAEYQGEARNAKKAFQRGIPLLLIGQTGSGKERFASWVHENTSGSRNGLIALNCAAIPESLIESELFGYVQGAFTGASKSGQMGKILQANGGTLFLDEIGDMPLSTQTRLLRVLQERKVTPIGGNQEIPVEFGLISATHHDLQTLIRQGAFRQDLYYRICGFRITLPSLSKRSDFDKVVQTILKSLSTNGASVRIVPSAMQVLKQYSWPGNIRQLESVLRVAALLADGNPISIDHLPEDICIRIPNSEVQNDEFTDLAKLEAGVIEDTLKAVHGNVSAAAGKLGISRATLYNKLSVYGIKNRFRP